MSLLSWSRKRFTTPEERLPLARHQDDHLEEGIELSDFVGAGNPTDRGAIRHKPGPSTAAGPRKLLRRGKTRHARLRRTTRTCCHIRAPIVCLQWALMLLGLIQVFNLSFEFFAALFPDALDWVSEDSGSLSHFPTADVHPIACHSHNDYWRRDPLFTAIEAGCTGVEADVWLRDDDLYIGHNVASLTPNHTLESLYLHPLIELLGSQDPTLKEGLAYAESRNGIFETDPDQSLILLIDFKENDDRVWDTLVSQLKPLRDLDYLSYFNGSSVVSRPVTVVASGQAPFARVVENPSYRFIFFDAPLDLLADVAEKPTPKPKMPAWMEENYDHYDAAAGEDSKHPFPIDGRSGWPGGLAPRAPNSSPANAAVYSAANSYYASVSFKKSIGYPWHSRLSRAQMDLLRRQIRGAHARGLKVRYWEIPHWPVGLRNYIWRVLIREGVDYLNVDNIRAATQENWGPRKGGWGRKWWG